MVAPVLLGIEVGGTKLQLGLGAGDGKILAMERRAIVPGRGSAVIRDQIREAAEVLLHRTGLDAPEAVALGFGGPVDCTSGSVLTSNQVAGWDGFPLRDWLAEAFGTARVSVHNDSDAAALAEALFGAGVGCSPLLYVNSGSGVGGGLIVDGRVYRGSGRGSLEIGHARVHVEGLGVVELEAVASGWGIARSARGLAPDGTPLDAERVALAARRGDPVAQGAIDRAVIAMSEALANAVNLLGPRRIVLGGGVSLMGEALWVGPIRDALSARVYSQFRDTYDVVTADLGQDVVVHGALALARQTL